MSSTHHTQHTNIQHINNTRTTQPPTQLTQHTLIQASVLSTGIGGASHGAAVPATERLPLVVVIPPNFTDTITAHQPRILAYTLTYTFVRAPTEIDPRARETARATKTRGGRF